VVSLCCFSDLSENKILIFIEILQPKVSDDRIYALANTGSFKIFSIAADGHDVLKLIFESDKSKLRESHSIFSKLVLRDLSLFFLFPVRKANTNVTQYYKSFVRLDDDRVVFLNSQSYIALLNLERSELAM
jgi:hypothetical protein